MCNTDIQPWPVAPWLMFHWQDSIPHRTPSFDTPSCVLISLYDVLIMFAMQSICEISNSNVNRTLICAVQQVLFVAFLCKFSTLLYEWEIQNGFGLSGNFIFVLGIFHMPLIRSDTWDRTAKVEHLSKAGMSKHSHIWELSRHFYYPDVKPEYIPK